MFQLTIIVNINKENAYKLISQKYVW